MVNEIIKKIEIEADRSGDLHYFLGEISESIKSIRDSLEIANQLKAEELAANRKAGSMDMAHEVLKEHWKYLNDYR